MHETSRPGGSTAVAAMTAAPSPSAARAADSAETARRLIEDHDRVANDVNDVVAHRLFRAGLSLQTALGQMDGHQAGQSIQDAIAQLDQAIIDLRDTVFRDMAASGSPG